MTGTPTQTSGTPPLRVAHYLWSASVGGIERLVLDLATVQAESAEIEPTIVFGKAEGSFRTLFGDDLPVVNAGLTSGAHVGLGPVRTLTRAFQRADIVHLHSFHPAVALAAARAGTPVVFTEHGVFGRAREGHLSHRVLHGLKGRFLRHRSELVTFNSEYTLGVGRAQYGLDRVPVEVVYNGTRLDPDPASEPADAETWARCRGRFVVGTASRLDAQKRIDRLIDAFAAWGAPNALLLIVGDGPERESLEQRARTAGIADRTLFTGYQSPATAYQRLMDVCVLPSQREAFGLTTVEAFALGLPAIVFHDAGGAVEVVSPLEPDDVVADVDGLVRRLDHYRHAVPGAGADRRRDHARRFDIRIMADRFDRIYRRTLAEGATLPSDEPVQLTPAVLP